MRIYTNKGTILIFLIVSLLIFSSGCQRVSKEDEYSYEIKTTIDYSSDSLKIPIFKYQRPFFEETSELAKEINSIFDEEEKNMLNEIKGYEEYSNNPECPEQSPDYRWYHTIVTECTYEKDGIVSLATHYGWYMGHSRESWTIGRVYDFSKGTQLTLRDFIDKSDEEIEELILSKAISWCDEQNIPLSDIRLSNIKEKTSSDMNFYLDEDGIHALYRGIIPRTGVDLLIQEW